MPVKGWAFIPESGYGRWMPVRGSRRRIWTRNPIPASTIRVAVVCVAFALPIPVAHGATIAVNGTADEVSSNGACSLREAIQAANTDAAVNECTAGSGADTVAVPKGTFSLALPGPGEDANATGDLDLLSDLTLQGAGATRTTIDAAALDRVLDVLAGTTVTVDAITLTGGSTAAGTAGTSPTPVAGTDTFGGPGGSSENGGGIRNAGTLTVQNSEISDNATGSGGPGGSGVGGAAAAPAASTGRTGVGGSGGASGLGGGIFSSGTLIITDSTLTQNETGVGGFGGLGVGSPGRAASAGGATGGTGGAGVGGNGGPSGSGGAIHATRSRGTAAPACR